MGGALLALAAVLAQPRLAGNDAPERLTKPEYERAVQVAYADVQAAFLATRVEPEELPARVADAAASLRRAAASLGSIQPPQRVAREHAGLVAGLAGYAALLERSPDGSVEPGESLELIAESAERMKFKGFDLGRIAKD